MRTFSVIAMLLFSGLLFVSFAQDSIHITGTVSDGTTGLSQAFVLLKSEEFSVETGPSGAFSIIRSGPPAGVMSQRKATAKNLTLLNKGGRFFLEIPSGSDKIRLRQYDIQGRLLQMKTFRAMLTGATVDLNGLFFFNPHYGQFIISISEGTKTFNCRVMSLGDKIALPNEPSVSSMGGTAVLSKSAAGAFDDTLIINRIGYYPRRIPLSSSIADFSGANAIVMQKSPIPCIDVGGLMIGFVNKFRWIYDDRGSGNSRDLSIWEPMVDSADGFKPLGSYAKNGYTDPSGTDYVVVVKELDTSLHLLASPIDYGMGWVDNALTSNNRVTCWHPEAPAGYVSCGTLAKDSVMIKPSPDEIVCVRQDLATEAAIGSELWVYYQRTFSTITPKTNVPTFGAFPLAAGTFIDYLNNHTVPTVYSLCVNIPMVMDNIEPPVLPKLSGLTEPPNETTPYFGRVMMVPFSVINDTTVSNAWQVVNVPFYRVERYQYYHKLFYMINNGSTDWPWSEAITTGITQEQTQRFWNATGISVTSNAGFEFKGFSGGVSVTVSQEFGYESSSSISMYNEKTVTKTATVPPHSIGILWQKNDLVLMKRCNSAGQCQTVSAENIPLESYYYDEIPVP